MKVNSSSSQSTSQISKNETKKTNTTNSINKQISNSQSDAGSPNTGPSRTIPRVPSVRRSTRYTSN